MIKKKIQRLLATAFATILIVGNFNGITVKAIEPIKKTNEVVSVPKLNPTPQNLKVTGEGFEITKSVNIVGEDVADIDAIRILKEFLKSNNIAINENYSDESTTLIIGESDDNIQELNKAKEDLNIKGSSELGNEGYILATSNDNKEAGEIVIEGKDEVGTFYGVQTLKQIIENKDEKVVTSELSITDEPDMKIRGAVEGFYGVPWSQEQRIDQFEFYGENKLNLYIYAPKDDPYHRLKWREPYPSEELDRMKELINKAKENKVDFTFAISPGIDIRFDGQEGEDDFKALINKAESLYEMGVRSFAIYWDDIEDKSGDKQAEVLNRFNREFVKAKGDVKPLITVPTEYWSDAMIKDGVTATYTQAFADTLDKDIQVMWTGWEIVTEGVDKAEAERVSEVFGRKMALWWNYPVSDFYTKKLAIGPMYNLDKSLNDNVGMFAINPMEHAETSKIAIYTGADYSWNLADYDYDKSWNNAIESLYGKNAEDFKYFANHSTRMDAGRFRTGREDAPEMRALIDTMWDKLLNGKDATTEIDKLYDEFDKMQKVSDSLKENLPEVVLRECTNQLDAFKTIAKYDKVALDMVVALLNGDMNTWWSLKNESAKHITEMNNLSGVLSEKVAQAFVSEAHEKGNILYENSLASENDTKISYSATANTNPLRFSSWSYKANPYELENIFSDNVEKVFMSEENVSEGSYIQLDLGAEININNIYLLQGKTANDNIVDGKIQYSLDGENWTDLESNSGDHEYLNSSLDINARYVRYVSTDNYEFPWFVREFKVNKKSVSNEELTSSVEGFNSSVVRGIEENEITILGTFEGEKKVKAGDTFKVKLRDFKFVSEATVDFGIDGKVEYSNNGIDWTSKEDNKSIAAKYIRFTATEDGTVKNPTIKVNLEGRINTTITTNYTKDTSVINDYDMYSTFVVGATQEGDYIQLDLGKETHVRDIRLAFNEFYGGDRYRTTKIEYSIDGETWNEVTVGLDNWFNEIKDLDITARYIRATNQSTLQGVWTRIADFSVNNLTPEVDFEATVNGMQPGNRVVNLNDKDLSSSYIPEKELKTGDYIVYRLYENRNISKVNIVQSVDKISNAKVIARTIDNEIIELGVLDKGYNTFDISGIKSIESIKVEFTGNSDVEIYEITPEITTLEKAIEESNKLINHAKELLNNTSEKSEEVVTELTNAVEKLQGVINATNSKDDIFKAYKELEKAINNFESNKPDISNPDKDDNNQGGDNDNTEDNNDEEDKNTVTKPEVSKPSKTGDVGAVSGTMMFIGSALAALGFKRKKNE